MRVQRFKNTRNDRTKHPKVEESVKKNDVLETLLPKIKTHIPVGVGKFKSPKNKLNNENPMIQE